MNDEEDNYLNINTNSKEKLLESEKDALFDLNSLSVQFLRIQKSIKEIENIFSSNQNQQDYSKGMHILNTQKEQYNKYFSHYSLCKSSFLSFHNTSKEDKLKYDKFVRKIDPIIKQLVSKIDSLTIKGKNIKSKYNYEDIDYNSMSMSCSIISYEPKITEKEVIHQADYLEKRRQDLNQVKIVSSQIKAMSEDLNLGVHEQQDALNNIEKNVGEIKDDVNKADNEIIEADKLNKSANKKTIWIIVIILFIVVAAAAITLTVIFNK